MAKKQKNQDDLPDPARVAERGDAEEAASSMIVYDKDGKPVFAGSQVPPDAAIPEEQVGEATGEDYDPMGEGDDTDLYGEDGEVA